MTAEEALAFANKTLTDWKHELECRHQGDWNQVGTLKIQAATAYLLLARELREAS